jgi:hypothetical protein
MAQSIFSHPVSPASRSSSSAFLVGPRALLHSTPLYVSRIEGHRNEAPRPSSSTTMHDGNAMTALKHHIVTRRITISARVQSLTYLPSRLERTIYRCFSACVFTLHGIAWYMEWSLRGGGFLHRWRCFRCLFWFYSAAITLLFILQIGLFVRFSSFFFDDRKLPSPPFFDPFHWWYSWNTRFCTRFPHLLLFFPNLFISYSSCSGVWVGGWCLHVGLRMGMDGVVGRDTHRKYDGHGEREDVGDGCCCCWVRSLIAWTTTTALVK